MKTIEQQFRDQLEKNRDLFLIGRLEKLGTRELAYKVFYLEKRLNDLEQIESLKKKEE